MFLDAKGEPDPAKSRDSGLAVGVPGTVAGLALAHRKYGSGKLSLAELIAPAIRLAQQGFPVEDDIANSLPQRRRAAGTLAVLGGDFPRWRRAAGTKAAACCNPISPTPCKPSRKTARAAFYQGRIAEQIAAAVRGAGGIMTAEDLKNYRAVEREPVRGTYRGYDIVSMPPPSSGGVA